jgi:hypothetical protein
MQRQETGGTPSLGDLGQRHTPPADIPRWSLPPPRRRQPPGVSDALHLGLLEVPLKLNKLHQALTFVPGVEALGQCLHQCRLMQAEVPLSPIKLDFLLPQHHVEVEGVLGVGGVRLHLVEVLLPSSLDFCSLDVKVGADLDQGHLRDPSFLLPRGKGLLPPRQLLLTRKKLLLQLFCHH